MLQQARDPLAIFDVGLPPRYRLDMLRVDEQQLEVPLQNLVDRAPVHARGRPEGANLLGPGGRRTGTPQAGGHRPLMHVESAADLVEHLHSLASLGPRRLGGVTSLLSILRALPARAGA